MRVLLVITVLSLTSVYPSQGQKLDPSGSAAPSAPAEIRRVALVISTENYDNVDRVPNALRDGLA
jgi:hypothetical protein